MHPVLGLEEIMAREIKNLDDMINELIDAYRYDEVSNEEVNKYATIFENARSYMFTFLWYPGMKGHTNDIKLLIKLFIKQRFVLPQRRRVDPWAGRPQRKTQVNLQTIHANVEIWGVFPGQIVSGRWHLESAAYRQGHADATAVVGTEIAQQALADPEDVGPSHTGTPLP